MKTKATFNPLSGNFDLVTSELDASTEISGTLPIANGGTGQTSQTAAFDALAPTTTKGDLIVSDGTDNVRLPVGADTYILVADSAQAKGIKWAPPGASISAIALINRNALPTVGGYSGSNNIKWGTPQQDTNSAYNDSTGEYTAPVTGFYSVTASIDLSGSASAGDLSTLFIAINGTNTFSNYIRYDAAVSSLHMVRITALVYVTSGDTISITISSTVSGVAISSDSNRNFLTISYEGA